MEITYTIDAVIDKNGPNIDRALAAAEGILKKRFENVRLWRSVILANQTKWYPLSDEWLHLKQMNKLYPYKWMASGQTLSFLSGGKFPVRMQGVGISLAGEKIGERSYKIGKDEVEMTIQITNVRALEANKLRPLPGFEDQHLKEAADRVVEEILDRIFGPTSFKRY